jgi:SnoaL-like domain
VNESPIERLLAATDALDIDALVALYAPEGRLLAADGRRAEGTEEVRELLTSILGALRSTNHEVKDQWQVDDTWIAEVEASYELPDLHRVDAVPLALIVRPGPEGIADVRIYGAQKRPVSEYDTGEQWGTLVRGHWIPPL